MKKKSFIDDLLGKIMDYRGQSGVIVDVNNDGLVLELEPDSRVVGLDWEEVKEQDPIFYTEFVGKNIPQVKINLYNKRAGKMPIMDFVEEVRGERIILDHTQMGYLRKAVLEVNGKDIWVMFESDSKELIEDILERDPEMQTDLDMWLDEKELDGWSDDIEEFCKDRGFELMDADNSSNWEGFWGDVFEIQTFEAYGNTYSIISYHLGGDVRGNYGSCIVYRGDYFEEVHYFEYHGRDELTEVAYMLG